MGLVACSEEPNIACPDNSYSCGPSPSDPPYEIACLDDSYSDDCPRWCDYNNHDSFECPMHIFECPDNSYSCGPPFQDPPYEIACLRDSYSDDCRDWCDYNNHDSFECPNWCAWWNPEECPANSVNGYWKGYGGYGTDEDENPFEVEAIFLDGKFIFFDDDSIVSGKYTIDNGELLSMDAKVYEMNGPYVDNIQINSNQTVYGESRITADVVLADENSTLDLDYEPFSETAISYSDFAGDWYFDSDNELTYIAAVDEQGTFYSVVDECTISGSISIPKTNLFIFDVELTIAGDECEVIGSYDGLGVLYEDQINMFYTNDEYGFNSILLRQDPNDVANTSRD